MAQLFVPAVEIGLHAHRAVPIALAQEMFDAQNARLVFLPLRWGVDGGRRRQITEGRPFFPGGFERPRRIRLFLRRRRLILPIDQRQENVAGAAFALGAFRQQHRRLFGEAIDLGPTVDVVARIFPDFEGVDAVIAVVVGEEILTALQALDEEMRECGRTPFGGRPREFIGARRTQDDEVGNRANPRFEIGEGAGEVVMEHTERGVTGHERGVENQ